KKKFQDDKKSMPKKSRNILNLEISFGRIGLREKALFANNLAIMLKSGLSISEAFDILENQTEGKFKKIIKKISKNINSGNPLSKALKFYPKIFSEFFLSSIMAGETAGTLDENLKSVGAHYDKQKDLLEKIRAACAYPLIILFLSFLIGLLLTFWVLPKITSVFSGLDVELPASTRFLIWLANSVEFYGAQILLVLFFLMIFLIWLAKQKFIKPITHYIFLHFPIFSNLVRVKNLALFFRTLAVLLRSGISIDESLAIAGNTLGNYYYKESAKKIIHEINQGKKLSEALRSQAEYYPKLAAGLVMVGERSGNLEEEFFNIAEIYEREAESRANNLSSAVEPILLIIIGFVVGGLALSIITPIYTVTGGIYK
ncbi:type II secretion system F family protein, partial [Candidatus Parcubacteria bacterium]|nr:type II secretion system F family protein [Candidatus Parcubacteria bacterium]